MNEEMLSSVIFFSFFFFAVSFVSFFFSRISSMGKE